MLVSGYAESRSAEAQAAVLGAVMLSQPVVVVGRWEQVRVIEKSFMKNSYFLVSISYPFPLSHPPMRSLVQLRFHNRRHRYTALHQRPIRHRGR